MNCIEVKGIKCYAFHGCLEEESKIGQEYIINVELFLDLGNASAKDELENTIDYCEVYSIVKEQMNIRSKLIETVGTRIAKTLKNNWKELESVKVQVIKPFPPIGGDVEQVSISVTA